MQREKRETRDRQGFFPGLGPRRVVGPARPAGSGAALQPVRAALHRGGEPLLLLAVGLESRLPVQRENRGCGRVARGELSLLRAREQRPPSVGALGREEKLELALVGRDAVLRKGPQRPRSDADVIGILPLGKPAPAGALGSGDGAEVLLDQFDVGPADVVRIVFSERDEDLRGDPGLARELLVQAHVERRGKLFRFPAGGPARFVGKRHDPIRGEYHAAIAPGRFRKNRGEAGPEHDHRNERRHPELAPVASTDPGPDGFESLRRARAHLAYLNDPPMQPAPQPAPDGIDRAYGVPVQPVRVGAQLVDVGAQLVDIAAQSGGVGPDRASGGAHFFRSHAVGPHGFRHR